MQVQVTQTEHFKDGQYIELFKIVNTNGFEIKLTNYGCTIMNILWPLANGEKLDVLLGYDTVDKYIDDKAFFGATAGRCCNRIRNAKIKIDELEYHLTSNTGDHHLHGGAIGFDKKTWRANIETKKGFTGVHMYLMSKNGDQGYPGNLSVESFIGLNEENNIIIEYSATTDLPTICNITSHPYFNLGNDKDILEHELYINAKQITLGDDDLIPTGELLDVKSTPFDFSMPIRIHSRLQMGHEQLSKANGFDQNFCLRPHTPDEAVASIASAKSGKKITFYTNQPGIQFYSGNHLNFIGKRENFYGKHSGLCLETQGFPNAINIPSFPSVLLRPEDKYYSQTKLSLELI